MYSYDALAVWVICGLISALFFSVVLWFAWFGRRYRWPDGARRVARWDGYTVHIITSGRVVATPRLQLACAKAVASAAKGWVIAKNTNGTHEKIGEVAIYFAPSEIFDADEHLAKKSTYLSTVPRFVGGGMPCAVIRAEPRYYNESMKHGEPVIHEMLHCLEGQFTVWRTDRAHADVRAWKAAGGKASAQHHAREHFLRIVG